MGRAKGDGGPRPPRPAEALLGVVLPGGAIREGVLGDLHELYRARRQATGAWRARSWYWSQALRLGLTYGGRRLRGQRFRGFHAHRPPGGQKRPGWGRGGGEGMVGAARQARLVIRSLVRNPGFTLPMLAVLAVGMTAVTAIFTVVDSIVFKPLDLPEAHRVVMVCEDHPDLGGTCIASPGNTEDLRRASGTLEELGFGRGWPFHLGDESGSEGVRGGLATSGFFRALGARAEVGRLFNEDEVGPGEDGVVVLSHGLWTTRYGADPGVVGRTVRLDGEPHRVVGVLTSGFEAPFDLEGIELWKPPHIDPMDPEVRGWRGFRAIGLLTPTASVAAAEAELTGLYGRLRRQHDEIDETWRVRVDSLQRVLVGDSRRVLLAFLTGAGLLLAIVCANVANLVLARGLARREELALRAALGAGRGRLVARILGESLVLAVVATGIAVVLAGGLSRLLLAVAPGDIPRLDEVALGGRVLAFAAVAALAVTAAFALAPALRATSWELGGTLRSGGREGEDRRSGRLRSGLLVAELALSVVLLASAGLLTRSFVRWLAWEPGFDHEHLLAVSAFVDTGKHPTRAEFMEVLRQGEERVAALPGVVAAATVSAGPLFGGGDGSMSFATDDTDLAGPLPSVWWYDAGPGYFATLGLPVLEGREITEDDGPGSELVAVVNETFVRAAWLDGEALGREVSLPELERTVRVVGVVADVPPLRPGSAARPEIWWSNRQLGRPAPFVLVRTSGDPEAMAAAVTGALLEVDPDLSLGTPYALTSSESRALVRPRFQALVMTALAVVALLLSVAGVYAVVSYAVARRVREMGIRRALGASSSRVVGMVVRASLGVSVAGVGLGLLAARWVGGLMAGMIPGVPAGDPASLVGASLILLGASALAAAVPAVRAARGDPLAAIRVD